MIQGKSIDSSRHTLGEVTKPLCGLAFSLNQQIFVLNEHYMEL